MSSAVAAFLHAIRSRVKIVPRGQYKIKFFCGAVPERRNVKCVSKTHKIKRKFNTICMT